MDEQNIYNLKINDEFKLLIPSLSSEELNQLEQNIVRDGCREPLCVWNSTIVDGHNRYEICSRLQIPFSIRKIQFKDEEEAIAWICANQLGRRNITEETRRYLIGKRYEMEKILGSKNVFGINQHKRKEVWPQNVAKPTFDENTRRTRDRLSMEYHLADNTIFRYGKYAQALDVLLETIPNFVPKVLSGEIKIGQDYIVALSKLPPKDSERISKQIVEDSNKFISRSEARKFLKKTSDSQKQQIQSAPNGSVKNMPVYDPDAGISSLAFTIPSWISSIKRTRSSTNFSEISSKARSQLKNELLELVETINVIITDIKEDN